MKEFEAMPIVHQISVPNLKLSTLFLHVLSRCIKKYRFSCLVLPSSNK